MTGAFDLTTATLLLSAPLCMVGSVREYNRGGYVLAGLMLLCAVLSVAALLRPMPTHAVKVDLTALHG